MKKKSLNVFAILLLIVSSCNFFNHDYYDEQLKLYRIKKSLHDSLWVGIPEKVDSNVRVLTSYNPVVLKHNLNYYGIFIKETLLPEEFQDKINLLNKQGIFQENFDEATDNLRKDSVFIFNIKGAFKEDSLKEDIKYIIPDYSSQFSPVKGLVSSKSNIIVLNSKFGIFNDNEYLDFSKTLSKHGLSKGVFYDDNRYEIIYWLIMW